MLNGYSSTRRSSRCSVEQLYLGRVAIAQWQANLMLTRLLTVVVTSVGLMCSNAYAVQITPVDFQLLASKCQSAVAPFTLASIAKVESSFDTLAIHDNTVGGTEVPVTRSAAVQLASGRLMSGHSLDLGLMQINSKNLSRLGLTVDDAFDACVSIRAAANILSSDYLQRPGREQVELRDAISRYNTGDTKRGYTNGYVSKVEFAARQLVPALEQAPMTTTTPTSPPPTTEDTRSWDVWGSDDTAVSPDIETPTDQVHQKLTKTSRFPLRDTTTRPLLQ